MGKKIEFVERNGDRNFNHTEREMLTKVCQIWGTVLVSITLMGEYQSSFININLVQLVPQAYSEKNNFIRVP